MKVEKFTFFWRSESPFSNWYRADFIIEGIKFNCSEQYMMYGKALLFGDEEIAEKILKSSSPGSQKDLGRKVKNFNQKKWAEKAREIVYKANDAKFRQNENLLKRLLKTKGTTLVEASPVDPIWGIGLAEDNPQAHDRSTWRGKNWLGQVLTQLREDILSENTED